MEFVDPLMLDAFSRDPSILPNTNSSSLLSFSSALPDSSSVDSDPPAISLFLNTEPDKDVVDEASETISIDSPASPAIGALLNHFPSSSSVSLSASASSSAATSRPRKRRRTSSFRSNEEDQTSVSSAINAKTPTAAGTPELNAVVPMRILLPARPPPTVSCPLQTVSCLQPPATRPASSSSVAELSLSSPASSSSSLSSPIALSSAFPAPAAAALQESKKASPKRTLKGSSPKPDKPEKQEKQRSILAHKAELARTNRRRKKERMQELAAEVGTLRAQIVNYEHIIARFKDMLVSLGSRVLTPSVMAPAAASASISAFPPPISSSFPSFSPSTPSSASTPVAGAVNETAVQTDWTFDSTTSFAAACASFPPLGSSGSLVATSVSSPISSSSSSPVSLHLAAPPPPPITIPSLSSPRSSNVIPPPPFFPGPPPKLEPGLDLNIKPEAPIPALILEPTVKLEICQSLPAPAATAASSQPSSSSVTSSLFSSSSTSPSSSFALFSPKTDPIAPFSALTKFPLTPQSQSQPAAQAVASSSSSSSPSASSLSSVDAVNTPFYKFVHILSDDPWKRLLFGSMLTPSASRAGKSPTIPSLSSPSSASYSVPSLSSSSVGFPPINLSTGSVLTPFVAPFFPSPPVPVPKPTTPTVPSHTSSQPHLTSFVSMTPPKFLCSSGSSASVSSRGAGAGSTRFPGPFDLLSFSSSSSYSSSSVSSSCSISFPSVPPASGNSALPPLSASRFALKSASAGSLTTPSAPATTSSLAGPDFSFLNDGFSFSPSSAAICSSDPIPSFPPSRSNSPFISGSLTAVGCSSPSPLSVSL